jgi:hypothetical protein
LAWVKELQNDYDKHFLLKGILNGFDVINPDAQLEKTFTQNHKSAVEPSVRDMVEDLIIKEIEAGNYVVTEERPTIISALGTVPKSDGSLRLIHDCSLPMLGGLNSHAPEFSKCAYESVDDAMHCLKKGYFAGKIDLRLSYRHVHVSRQSYHATGLFWTFKEGRSVYMYDAKLSFGARASPTIFHRLSQAVKRMMLRRGYTGIVAYQDDFLVTGSTYEKCLGAWNVMVHLLQELGFEINQKKLIHPCLSIVFLGIQLNMDTCELSLPEVKLQAIRACVAEFVNKKRATKHQLQVLVGKLNFAARVVRGARTFLRRLYNAISSLKKPHHKVRLQGAVRKDILFFHDFLSVFNGVAAFIDTTCVTPVLTDACILAGGAFHNGDIYYTVWEVDHPETDKMCINYKEAMVATLAIQR